jgi:hypothetical protein
MGSLFWWILSGNETWKGRYRWDDKSGYEGYWYNDRMHGYGVYVTTLGVSCVKAFLDKIII